MEGITTHATVPGYVYFYGICCFIFTSIKKRPAPLRLVEWKI